MSFSFLKEFIEQDVVKNMESRLKSLEKSSRAREDTKGFAFEDKAGNVIKVYVDSAQASDFESALASVLEDENDQKREIADILYDLKSHFTIKHVEWPKDAIPEDEEEEEDLPAPEVSAEEEKEDDEDGSESDEDQVDPLEDELDSAVGGDIQAPGNDLDAATDLLGKIIDMLRADAEAKTAASKAKEAEAEAMVSKTAKEVSNQRARREEEIIDMERYNDQQKQKREDEELRKRLIKYRHAIKNSTGEETMTTESFNDLSPEEEEILDMEQWEREEKQRKAEENKRDRLNRYRYAKKLKRQAEDEERKTRLRNILDKAGVTDIREMDFKSFLKGSK